MVVKASCSHALSRSALTPGEFIDLKASAYVTVVFCSEEEAMGEGTGVDSWGHTDITSLLIGTSRPHRRTHLEVKMQKVCSR